MTLAGFPHSEISGSTRVCRSPKLIAAYHVLHRRLMPRHPPCALISLTKSFKMVVFFRRILLLVLFANIARYAVFKEPEGPAGRIP